MERPSSRTADSGRVDGEDGGDGPDKAPISGPSPGNNSPVLEPQAALSRARNPGAYGGDRESRKPILSDEIPTSSSPSPYIPKPNSGSRSSSSTPSYPQSTTSPSSSAPSRFERQLSGGSPLPDAGEQHFRDKRGSRLSSGSTSSVFGSNHSLHGSTSSLYEQTAGNISSPEGQRRISSDYPLTEKSASASLSAAAATFNSMQRAELQRQQSLHEEQQLRLSTIQGKHRGLPTLTPRSTASDSGIESPHTSALASTPIRSQLLEAPHHPSVLRNVDDLRRSRTDDSPPVLRYVDEDKRLSNAGLSVEVHGRALVKSECLTDYEDVGPYPHAGKSTILYQMFEMNFYHFHSFSWKKIH